MIEGLFTVSWGRLTLWCAAVSTTRPRRLVVHQMTGGDDHPVDDRGLSELRTRVSVLFDEFEGEATTPLSRFRELEAAHELGTEAMFTHPIRGSFLAKIGDFSYDLVGDYGTPQNVSVEFVPVDTLETVKPAGFGTSGSVGEGAVSAAADELDAAFDAAGIALDEPPTDIGRAAAENWIAGDTVPTRQVIVDTADISARLGVLIDEQGLEDDLALWDVYYATIMFGNATRNAAIAATSEVPAVFTLRVRQVVAILPLMAKIYGGAEAEDRARQVEEMNDIKTPGWFGPGDLLLPVKTARSGF
jgi:hypothetical protein